MKAWWSRCILSLWDSFLWIAVSSFLKIYYLLVTWWWPCGRGRNMLSPCHLKLNKYPKTSCVLTCESLLLITNRLLVEISGKDCLKTLHGKLSVSVLGYFDDFLWIPQGTRRKINKVSPHATENWNLEIPVSVETMCSAPVQTGPRAHSTSCTMGSGPFPVVKRAGRGVDHPPPSSAKVNPLNAELKPICYRLALLAHYFLHVSRIRVKSLTLRLPMSYIYIYIWSTYSWCF